LLVEFKFFRGDAGGDLEVVGELHDVLIVRE